MRVLALIAFALLVLLVASTAQPQTISPLVSECSAKKCQGFFTVTNDSVVPLAVSISPYAVTFDPATKKPIFTALGATAHVTLSETSARIPPRAPHDFSYRISCDTLPCVIGLGALMSAGHTANGIQTKILLVTGVYVCESAKGCRDWVRKSVGR